MFVVSILLSQWIWLEGNCYLVFVEPLVGFQSFWVNGFGWKFSSSKLSPNNASCFNPSESMDLVGRVLPASLVLADGLVSILLSQWIWLEEDAEIMQFLATASFNPSESMDLVGRQFCLSSYFAAGFVSILLSQWIWLEVEIRINLQIIFHRCFNPSESMDLVGRWERKIHSQGEYRFNPSESMDLVGRVKVWLILFICHEFQSFWVNGFGWKAGG